jgi:hypothetical protein
MAQMVAHTLKAGQLIKNRVSGVSVQVSEQREVPYQPLVGGDALGIS